MAKVRLLYRKFLNSTGNIEETKYKYGQSSGIIVSLFPYADYEVYYEDVNQRRLAGSKLELGLIDLSKGACVVSLLWEQFTISC